MGRDYGLGSGDCAIRRYLIISLTLSKATRLRISLDNVLSISNNITSWMTYLA